MKQDVHPNYHEVNVTCSCGNKFTTQSVMAKTDFNTEVCSECHPFYTGKQKIVDTAGRVDKFNQKYGENVFEIEIKEQYLNMKKQFEGKMHIIEVAEKAMKNLGITPEVKAIRGGTDGAQLSYMGLPCPNIFAGGLNFHGPYEYVPLESMEKATEVIIEIAQEVEKL